MRNIIGIAVLAMLSSCGSDGDSTEVEKVELKTFKDTISYALGAEQAKMITQSGDPNLDRLNFGEIIKGFESNLSLKEAVDEGCKTSLRGLYGPNNQDFDTTYLVKASNCIGRIAGSVFYTNWSKKGVLDKIDMKIASIGFKHGLTKSDTIVSTEVKLKMMTTFVQGINKKSGDKMLAAAKKRPNTKIIDGGIIIETISEGTGGMPSASDDVKANYILTSAEGDTIENSFMYKEQNGQDLPAFNLAEVIKGWTMAFPNLKKGGKYRLFIPWDLAYGEQRNCESLVFYIEFNDFGPAGSLKQPPAALTPQQQMEMEMQRQQR